MAKKRGKPVSFDAMVKFFMHTYNIPTKRDIDRIADRLDRIERMIAGLGGAEGRGAPSRKGAAEKGRTAADVVLEIIRRHPEGAGFAEIQRQSGFDEKKLRNIIFRLSKLGAIQRKSRGIYIESIESRPSAS